MSIDVDQLQRSRRGQELVATSARELGISLRDDGVNVLVLNYTMQCALSCDFCCYGCHPKRPEKMPLELAQRLVDEAAAMGVFDLVGFTGGEAIIHYDDLLTLGTRLQSHGLPFSLVTACHWAADRAQTRRTLEPLVSRGLSILSVSHDRSHEQWVPRDNVARAVDEALRLGVRKVVIGASNYYADGPRLAELFPEFCGEPRVEYADRVVLPVGRATKRAPTREQYGLPPTRQLTCYKQLHHDITVFWDGAVYPCCSVFNRSTRGLVIGNANHQTLAELWDLVEGSALFRMLKHQGFGALYDLLRQRADPALVRSLPDPRRSLGPCELCHQVFKRSDLVTVVKEVIDTLEQEQVSQLLEAVRQAAGEQAASKLVCDVLGAELVAQV